MKTYQITPTKQTEFMERRIMAMLDSVEPQLRAKYPNADERFIKSETRRQQRIIFADFIISFCRHMKQHENYPQAFQPNP
jgi:hypothetical protein